MAGSTGPNIVNNGLILNLDAANIKSFKGEPTTNLVRNSKDFSGTQYGSDDEWVSSEPTRLTKSYVSNLLTPIGFDATLIYENGNTGYHHLSRFGGGDESGSHFLSCYIFPLSTITDFSIGLLADVANSITFNLETGAITYGGSISNRNAFLTPVNGFSGWYRVGANFEGRGGGWVGCLGYSIYSSYTGVNGGKQMYITGLQYEYKTKVTNFVDAQLTRGTTVATGGGWKDLTAIGYNGELVNGPTYNSDNGGSLVFDGTNDYISTALTGVINTMTVECWFKGTTTSRNHLWNFGSYGDNSNLNFNFNDSGYDLWVYWESGGGNRVRYIIDGSFTDSTIKHVVFTHIGSTNKVYLNGSELSITESGGTQTFTAVNNSGYFGIGDIAPFQGNIYNVKVYNRALSSTEILQNYNSQKSRFGL